MRKRETLVASGGDQTVICECFKVARWTCSTIEWWHFSVFEAANAQPARKECLDKELEERKQTPSKCLSQHKYPQINKHAIRLQCSDVFFHETRAMKSERRKWGGGGSERSRSYAVEMFWHTNTISINANMITRGGQHFSLSMIRLMKFSYY